MPARFWFDLRGEEGAAEGYPRSVVKALYSKGKHTKPTLAQFYLAAERFIPEDIEILPNYALYMSGTTDELQTALISDIAEKIWHLFVRNGQLAVWYIGRNDKETPIAELIVCIAGRGDGSGHYWNMHKDQTPADRGPPANHWKEMGLLDKRRLPLEELVNKMLPLGKGVAGWYPKFPGAPRRRVSPVEEGSTQRVVG